MENPGLNRWGPRLETPENYIKVTFRRVAAPPPMAVPLTKTIDGYQTGIDDVYGTQHESLEAAPPTKGGNTPGPSAANGAYGADTDLLNLKTVSGAPETQVPGTVRQKAAPSMEDMAEEQNERANQRRITQQKAVGGGATENPAYDEAQDRINQKMLQRRAHPLHRTAISEHGLPETDAEWATWEKAQRAMGKDEAEDSGSASNYDPSDWMLGEHAGVATTPSRHDRAPEADERERTICAPCASYLANGEGDPDHEDNYTEGWGRLNRAGVHPHNLLFDDVDHEGNRISPSGRRCLICDQDVDPDTDMYGSPYGEPGVRMHMRQPGDPGFYWPEDRMHHEGSSLDGAEMPDKVTPEEHQALSQLAGMHWDRHWYTYDLSNQGHGMTLVKFRDGDQPPNWAVYRYGKGGRAVGGAQPHSFDSMMAEIEKQRNRMGGGQRQAATDYPWEQDEPVDYQYERDRDGSPIEPSPDDDLRKLEGLGWQTSRYGTSFRTDPNGVEHRLYPMWKQNMGRRYWDLSSAIDGPNGTRRTEQNFYRTPEEAHAGAGEASARLGTDPDLGEAGVVGMQHRRTTDWPVETRSLFDRMSHQRTAHHDLTQDIHDVLDVQGAHGNWNSDPYMHGMFNGMELVGAIHDGREPEFRDAPDEWLSKDAGWDEELHDQYDMMPFEHAMGNQEDPLYNPMADSIHHVDPRSPQYDSDYERGWQASRSFGDGDYNEMGGTERSPLEKLDDSNASHAAYDGYMDEATGRRKHHLRAVRRLGLDNPEDLPDEHWDHPEKVASVRRMSAPEIQHQGDSPLDYNMGTEPGDPWHAQRLGMVDSEAGEPAKGETYYAEGRQPAAAPGTVAFVDYSHPDPGLVYIHYMSTRGDQRGRGHQRKLVEDLIARHPGVETVDFGKEFEPEVTHLRQSMQKAHPEIYMRGKVQHFGAAPVEPLKTEQYQGTEGNNRHITRNEMGMVPIEWVCGLKGAAGERPGQHRNYQGDRWEHFKSQVAAGAPGYSDPIFIMVDHGSEPRIGEGNHRRDAYVENRATHVPVEIRYYGHSERQGTLGDRVQKQAAFQRTSTDPDWMTRDDLGRFAPKGTRKRETLKREPGQFRQAEQELGSRTKALAWDRLRREHPEVKIGPDESYASHYERLKGARRKMQNKKRPHNRIKHHVGQVLNPGLERFSVDSLQKQRYAAQVPSDDPVYPYSGRVDPEDTVDEHNLQSGDDTFRSEPPLGEAPDRGLVDRVYGPSTGDESAEHERGARAHEDFFDMARGMPRAHRPTKAEDLPADLVDRATAEDVAEGVNNLMGQADPDNMAPAGGGLSPAQKRHIDNYVDGLKETHREKVKRLQDDWRARGGRKTGEPMPVERFNPRLTHKGGQAIVPMDGNPYPELESPIYYVGDCEGCHTKLFDSADSSGDPRGAMGDHTVGTIKAAEYDATDVPREERTGERRMHGPTALICPECDNEHEKHQRVLDKYLGHKAGDKTGGYHWTWQRQPDGTNKNVLVDHTYATDRKGKWHNPGEKPGECYECDHGVTGYHDRHDKPYELPGGGGKMDREAGWAARLREA